ncbi:MAG: hypothetical protein Fur0032_09240 [Terrimicrobiaceae bacterium]
MQIVIGILLVVHVFVCLLLIGAVLMQLPRSEGLGAAFGGGVTENLFGAQTTNVLSKVTVWLGIAFFVLTLLLAMAYSHSQPTGSRLEQELLASPVPAASPAASPVADAATSQPAPEATPTATAADMPTPVETAPSPAIEQVPAAGVQ